MKKLFTTIIFIISVDTSVLADSPVNLGQRLVSPDKQFTVSVGGAVNNYKLLIEDNLSHETDDSILLLNLPLDLKWAADSKTILVVQHLAGGSFVSVIHFYKNRWIEADVQPPNQGPSVFKIKNIRSEKTGLIHLEYEVESDKGHGQWGDPDLVTFDFNPSDGSITNTQHRSSEK